MCTPNLPFIFRVCLMQMGITVGKINASDQLNGSEQLIVAA